MIATMARTCVCMVLQLDRGHRDDTFIDTHRRPDLHDTLKPSVVHNLANGDQLLALVVLVHHDVSCVVNHLERHGTRRCLDEPLLQDIFPRTKIPFHSQPHAMRDLER